MANSKGKKTSKRAGGARSARHGIAIVASVIGVTGLTIFGTWASVRVRDHVRQDPRYSITSWRLELVELPAWVTPEIKAELESLALVDPALGDPALGDSLGEDAEPGPLTLFDRGVLSGVRQQLERSPWVHRLVNIRLVYPTAGRRGSLQVELSLRRPMALVEYAGLYYLTDRRGRRLGAPYSYAPTEWFGIPRISGGDTSIEEIPQPGERWDSLPVQNGLWVASYLFDEEVLDAFAARPIEAIDVVNVGGCVRPRQSEIVLLWEGRRLTWGQAPLSDAPRTVSLETTLENLREVMRRPRAFEAYAEINLHREIMTGVRWASGVIEEGP